MKKRCDSCNHRLINKFHCQQCGHENILDETFQCIDCGSEYCSENCLMRGYKDANGCYASNEWFSYKDNLYFTCCDKYICGQCLEYYYHHNCCSGEYLHCEKCKSYFHNYNDDCKKIIEDRNGNCVCKLCIDLTNEIKHDICPKCHEDNKQKMFSYKTIKTISEFSDLLNTYEFNGCDTLDDNSNINNIKPKIIECKKMEYFKNLINKEYKVGDFIKTASIECNCELCNKINCKTTLLANIIGNEYIIDITNSWDYGENFTPIKALNMLAKNESNNCKCLICKFFSEYK